MINTEHWNILELELSGPSAGNPFTDVQLSADFRLGHRIVTVDGFYDGDGTYRIRFSPDAVGEWSYITRSNRSELSGKTGSFCCTPATGANHGPVRADGVYLRHADGTIHYSFGTTCYAWAHQGDELEEQTLKTLATAPFNKMRMCVFPKHYDFNHNEPVYYPFEKGADGKWDYTRLNPAFFRHFETRVRQLMDLGIEADIILFHPYDRWGFSNMGEENDRRYLRYLISRLAPYRNVWWSLANEYDIMKWPLAQWDRTFQLIQECDPYQRLRSIHNCFTWYDHGKPWVTHASIQNPDPSRSKELRQQYKKPVLFDECCYEGNIQHGWGNISARKMSRLFWQGLINGGHVGHGETYLHPKDILWWGKGGILHGQSAPRIAFCRKIAEEGPKVGWDPINWQWDQWGAGKGNEVFVLFYGTRTPAIQYYNLPDGHTYRAEIIDTWEMTITPVPGTFKGRATINLPGKEDIAVRLLKL